MVRLKGRDDLESLKGKLSADFHSVNLASLHVSLFASVQEADRKNAAQALDSLYQTAGRLFTSENEFNKRSRQAAAPSLMHNLRTPAHFTAMREFSAAKEGLLNINPKVSQNIIRLIEKDMAHRSSHHGPRFPRKSPRS
jgi:hypothetical protein